MTDPLAQTRWSTAIAIFGSIVAGVFGLAGALFAFFNVDPTGFGICVLASAVAFGLLANAVLRQ